MEHIIYLLLSTLVSAFVGSYFAGYLKKKGENLATHEDIDKLVAQVAAVTQATKEIEAKISNDVWERQRKWDVKREALFEAMRELAGVEYGLVNYVSTFAVQNADKRVAAEVWNTALVNFKRARILALLVCGQELKESFETLEKSLIAYVNVTTARESMPAPAWATIRAQIDALIRLVRRELNVD